MNRFVSYLEDRYSYLDPGKKNGDGQGVAQRDLVKGEVLKIHIFIGRRQKSFEGLLNLNN